MIARISKIESATNMFCEKCKPVFDENKKVDECYMSSNSLQKPYLSTYNICKVAEKFMYAFKQVAEDKKKFSTLYYLIFQDIDFENIFHDSDFSNHLSHKYHLVKCVLYNQFYQCKSKM